MTENGSSTFRWGLIKLRQNTPAWRIVARTATSLSSSATRCRCCTRTRPPAAPVRRSATMPSTPRASPTPNHAQPSAPAGTVVVTPAANTSATIITLLAKGPNDPLALIPAGTGGVGTKTGRSITRCRCESGRDRGDGGRHRGKPDVPQHRGRAHHGRQGQRRRGLYRGEQCGDDGDIFPVGDRRRRHQTCADRGRRRQAERCRCRVAADDCDEQWRRLSQRHDGARGDTPPWTTPSSSASRDPPISMPARQASSSRSAPSSGPSTSRMRRTSTGASLPNTDINSSPGGVHLPQRSNVMITAGFHPAGIRRLAACIPNLQTGRRHHQADRLEILE